MRHLPSEHLRVGSYPCRTPISRAPDVHDHDIDISDTTDHPRRRRPPANFASPTSTIHRANDSPEARQSRLRPRHFSPSVPALTTTRAFPQPLSTIPCERPFNDIRIVLGKPCTLKDLELRLFRETRAPLVHFLSPVRGCGSAHDSDDLGTFGAVVTGAHSSCWALAALDRHDGRVCEQW